MRDIKRHCHSLKRDRESDDTGIDVYYAFNTDFDFMVNTIHMILRNHRFRKMYKSISQIHHYQISFKMLKKSSKRL